MINEAERLSKVNEYYFSKKLAEIEQINQQSEIKIINLGIGSPDLPPHNAVIEELYNHAKLPNTHAYQSYKGSLLLREAFAEFYKNKYGVENINPQKEILPLIGSKEGIMHICQSFLNTGDYALVPNPGYPTYQSAVLLSSANVAYYNLTQENNWYPKIEELESIKKELGSKLKLIFVSYPHMPSGQKADIKVLEDLINWAKKSKVLVVHDNPYSFIRNENPISILSCKNAWDCCLELNSLSKSHNMAGWRIGVIMAKEEYINTILKFKSNMDSGMFLPLQLAAVKALQLTDDWYKQLNETYNNRYEAAIKIFDALGISYNQNQTGMFIWGSINDKYENAFAFSDEILYNKKVFITPGGIFGSNGNNYLRISLCAKIEVLEQALKRITE